MVVISKYCFVILSMKNLKRVFHLNFHKHDVVEAGYGFIAIFSWIIKDLFSNMKKNNWLIMNDLTYVQPTSTERIRFRTYERDLLTVRQIVA
jgi:hypothetical protein